jgi:hypothetical protein
LLIGHNDPDGPLYESGLVRRDALATLRRRGEHGTFATWTLGLLSQWSARNLAGDRVGQAVTS